MTTSIAPASPAVPVHPITEDPAQRADRYYELLALSTEDLERELAATARAELAMDEPARYAAVRARLLGWLHLTAEDRRILARAFERVAGTLPIDDALELIEAERAVAMNSLTFDEFRQLAPVLGWTAADEVALAA